MKLGFFLLRKDSIFPQPQGPTTHPPPPADPLDLQAGPSRHQITVGVRVSKEPLCLLSYIPESGAWERPSQEGSGECTPPPGSPRTFQKQQVAMQSTGLKPGRPPPLLISWGRTTGPKRMLPVWTCVQGRSTGQRGASGSGVTFPSVTPDAHPRSLSFSQCPWAGLQNPEWAAASPSGFKELPKAQSRLLVAQKPINRPG